MVKVPYDAGERRSPPSIFGSKRFPHLRFPKDAGNGKGNARHRMSADFVAH